MRISDGSSDVCSSDLAAALVIATGGDVAQTLGDLARVQPVRGRLERAALTKTGAPVYVDYAHTPDGLRAALEALRPHAGARLILVFGAGVDRDTGQSPGLGRGAAGFGDLGTVPGPTPPPESPT